MISRALNSWTDGWHHVFLVIISRINQMNTLCYNIFVYLAAQSVIFYVEFCRSLFFTFFRFIFGLLRCTSSNYTSLVSWDILYKPLSYRSMNRIGGVMVSVLISSAVDRGFEPQSDQTKDNKIGICCFCVRHKDWLARNQNNVSEWSDRSTRGLLFQWASIIKIKISMLG